MATLRNFLKAVMYLLQLEQSFCHFSDSSKNANLQFELAAIVDYSEPFVKATYKFEGDGPLALECYEAYH